MIESTQEDRTSSLNWQVMETMPDDRRNGRLMPLWSVEGPDIASWTERPTWPDLGYWELRYNGVPVRQPTYWADLHGPV